MEPVSLIFAILAATQGITKAYNMARSKFWVKKIVYK